MKKWDIIIENDIARIIEYHKEGHGKYILNFEPAQITKPVFGFRIHALLILGYYSEEIVTGSYSRQPGFSSQAWFVKKIS